MSGGIDSFGDLVLAYATGQGGSTEQVLGDTDFIIRGRCELLEPSGEFIGVVESVLHGSGHGHHLKNLVRAVIA